MPRLRVRDKQTGKVDVIDWNQSRPPTPDEIRAEVAKIRGSKMPVSRSTSADPDPWSSIFSDKEAKGGLSAVIRGDLQPAPSRWDQAMNGLGVVTDTMWGGEKSVLPAVPGLTRPLAPEIPREAWGPDEMRWKPQMVPGTMLPQLPGLTNWAYDNVLRPSTSVVGAASDWLTGKVGRAVAAPVIHAVAPYTRPLFNKARSIFGTTVKAAEEVVPAAGRSAQLALPERASGSPSRFAVDEKGLATDITRPYSPLEARPFDPRTARGPSGTVNPNTGRVAPLREGGRFAGNRPLDPVPTVKPSELPVVDIPPEVSAAYPPRIVPERPNLPRVGPPGTTERYRTAAAQAAEDAAHKLSPTDPRVRSGPPVRERVGAPQARRVGETREAFRARVAGKDPVSRVAADLAEEAKLGNPRAERAAAGLKSAGSGQSTGAAATDPASGFWSALPARLRRLAKDETGELNAKFLLDRLLREQGEAARTFKGKAVTTDPRDPAKVIIDALTPDELAKAQKLGGRGWKERLREFVASEEGSARLPKVGAPGGPAITLPKPSIFTKPGRERIKREAIDALNVPRASMAALDLSGFRQAIGVMHKKELYKSIPSMLKSLGSEKAFEAVQHSIATHPKFSRMRKAGLALSDLKNYREELFMSKMAEKIPVYGRLVRASGRAYVSLLNKTRADIFDNLTEAAAKAGAKSGDKELARFINAATGRGNLPKALERAAPVLNAAFFSPRLMSSRLTMLNPKNYIATDPFVRKEFWKSAAAIGTVWGGLTGLVTMINSDAETELDPRSTDFGKIQVGNARVDFSGGFQPYLRVAAQVAPDFMGGGQLKDVETKKLMKLGEGRLRNRTRLDVLESFAENKLAPLFTLGVTMLRGRTFSGDKPQLLPDVGAMMDDKSEIPEQLLSKSEITKRLAPLIAQDLYELWKEDPELVPWIGPGALGAGINVHKRRAVKRRYQ